MALKALSGVQAGVTGMSRSTTSSTFIIRPVPAPG
jgi:hypothetical protein